MKPSSFDTDEARALLAQLPSGTESPVRALLAALELRSEETAEHCLRVARYARRLHAAVPTAVGSQCVELAGLLLGALLHDIGKIGVPDAILLKPEALNSTERAQIEQHTLLGAQLIDQIEVLASARAIVLHHHERWDGSGYPDGLEGHHIPPSARLFAVVDVFDALTSDRPYRRAWPWAKAADYLFRNRGSHFDPAMVDTFMALAPAEWGRLR